MLLQIEQYVSAEGVKMPWTTLEKNLNPMDDEPIDIEIDVDVDYSIYGTVIAIDLDGTIRIDWLDMKSGMSVSAVAARLRELKPMARLTFIDSNGKKHQFDVVSQESYQAQKPVLGKNAICVCSVSVEEDQPNGKVLEFFASDNENYLNQLADEQYAIKMDAARYDRYGLDDRI